MSTFNRFPNNKINPKIRVPKFIINQINFHFNPDLPKQWQTMSAVAISLLTSKFKYPKTICPQQLLPIILQTFKHSTHLSSPKTLSLATPKLEVPIKSFSSNHSPHKTNLFCTRSSFKMTLRLFVAHCKICLQSVLLNFSKWSEPFWNNTLN